MSVSVTYLSNRPACTLSVSLQRHRWCHKPSEKLFINGAKNVNANEQWKQFSRVTKKKKKDTDGLVFCESQSIN